MNVISQENCHKIDKPTTLSKDGGKCMQDGQSDGGWDEFSMDDIWNLLNQRVMS